LIRAQLYCILAATDHDDNFNVVTDGRVE